MRLSFPSLIATLFAVLALLANPVATAAARTACAMGDAPAAMARTSSDMASMPGMAKAGQAATVDPCCDHSGQQKPTDGKSCALTCASGCVAAAVALPALTGHAFTYERLALAPASAVWPCPHAPSGLERPPKSIL
jgi:hypothetical protein